MTTQVYTNGAKKSSFVCPYEPKTADALKWALRMMGITIRLNDRSHMAEWQTGQEVEGGVDEDGIEFYWEKPRWVLSEWEPLTDEARQYLRDEMQKQVRVKFGQEGFDATIKAVIYKLHMDPLLEYFKSLPPPTGRNILQNTLARCMRVEPGSEDLARWASVYIFLGVVWRTFKPGTKLDEIPVLVGGGGIGKSTFLELAVPPDIPRLYGSGLDLSSTPQRMVESILSRAIVEIDEMVGAGAGDMGRIKGFITRTNDDGVRLVYRYNPEDMPRRCIMVGTADRDQFLPPDDNHRRFVPIMLGRGDARKVRTYMAKNRERLWIEAVGLYHKGVTAHLPDSLKGLAEVAVKKAQWVKR